MNLINAVWAKYDTDRSGELNLYQAKKFITHVVGVIPDKVFQHVFKTFDNDGSGAIGKHEMVEFMNAISEEKEDQSPAKYEESIKI